MRIRLSDFNLASIIGKRTVFVIVFTMAISISNSFRSFLYRILDIANEGISGLIQSIQ